MQIADNFVKKYCSNQDLKIHFSKICEKLNNDNNNNNNSNNS